MVKVDQKKCIGCGMCAGLCPETFKMNPNGKAEVVAKKVTAGAKKAKENCPVEAISLD